jgi:CRP/FNR family transcriptional regulator, cyclic AMP receptor protein
MSGMRDHSAMSPELWADVVAEGRRRSYPAGSLIFAEGDAGGPVLAIRHGSVAITAGGGGRLDELGPGELLGELSAVDGLPRSASAIAVTDTEVLAIEPGRFGRLLVDQPQLALYLLRSVGCRLRRATNQATPGVDVSAVAADILSDQMTSHRSEPTPCGVVALADRFDVSVDVMSRAIEHLVDRGAIAVDRGAVVVVDPIVLGTLAGPGRA